MKMGQQKFSKGSSVGFSIPELMVVIVIIGILASLAMPRLRSFIARSRQAEAKNLLAQIHTLQQTHQNFNDQFARWGSGASDGVGNEGSCPAAANTAGCSGCNTASLNGTGKTQAQCSGPGCVWAGTPGAFELGFKPQNCSDLRYGYWIERDVDANGIERYVAYAYGRSETNDRIYPTCNGAKASRSDEIKHPDVSSNVTATVTQGDLQAVDEDKTWYHADIIPNCE